MEQLKLRKTDLQWREVEGEVIALDVRGSQYLGVNDSGAALWEMLVVGTTRDQMAHHLADTYGLDLPIAQTHVDAFVHQLRAQHLIDEQG